jgi:hypothetical protein
LLADFSLQIRTAYHCLSILTSVLSLPYSQKTTHPASLLQPAAFPTSLSYPRVVPFTLFKDPVLVAPQKYMKAVNQ